ncbi:hypothetical protein NIES4072_66260 [Nostoc commune NIES-4072]|uniref:Uncharacterized protein n=1 Tax=Nostoc commune NIES-4072 TaxID=2005467 RepID=A0A2R5G566_NOSCO|nr:hypothetical protein NIES4070_66710 [Nostoc commune HK-02]GBG22914.1 hypothetical protein NIES4072_66260 [Nostoc commune NIES-4072]
MKFSTRGQQISNYIVQLLLVPTEQMVDNLR